MREEFKDVPSELQLPVHLVKNCTSAFSKAVPAEQAQTQPALTYVAFGTFLKRLHVLVGRSLLAGIVRSEGAKWDSDLLPTGMRGLGYAVKEWLHITREMQELANLENDWPSIIYRQTRFEAMSLALEHPVMDDKMMEQCKKGCQDYVDLFLQVAEKHKALLVEMKEEKVSFQEEYGRVVECAENWQMEPVQSFFDPANEDTMEAKIGDVADRIQHFVDNLNLLKKFMAHSSTNPKFIALVTELRDLQRQAV